MNTKNGYSKTTLTDSYVLTASGGHKAIGNSDGNIPLNNGTVNTNLNADMLDGYHASNFYKTTDTIPDTKVTNTLATTTKFYLTGTNSNTTNTGTQYFDTGIYSTTTAGQLSSGSVISRGSLYGGTNIYLRNGEGAQYARLYISTVGTACTTEGTYGTTGSTILSLGNFTKRAPTVGVGADNACGILQLYGTDSGSTKIQCGTNNSSTYTLYLPGDNGQLVYHTNDTVIGGSTTPVYVASTGKVTACSAYSTLFTDLTSNATTNLSATVGGTTKTITDLYARKWVKSTNPTINNANTDDTTAVWGALNNTMHYYNAYTLKDQPSQYGLLLNFNTGSAEVHQIWMTQASGYLYHRGGNQDGWSGTWRRILDSSDANAAKVWTAQVKGATWSRLCYVAYHTSVVGATYLINVKGTRSSVVYNNTYLVTAHHSGKANTVAIGSSNYSEVVVRACSDSNGNSYFELYDAANSATSSTTQNVYCTLMPIACGNVTQYTTFTNGNTLASGFTAGNELRTRPIEACIHAANFSASALTRSAEFALQKDTSTQSYMHSYISVVGTTSTGGIAYLKIGNAVATGSADNARGVLCVYGTGTSGAQIKCDSTRADDYELMLPAAAGRLVYHTTGSQIGSGIKPIYVSSAGKATASTSTVGNGSNPVYLSSGTITACSYPKSGAYFQGVPSVTSDGVMEIGRYIDFHPTNASTLDFSARLDCGTSTKVRTITLPDYPGTLLVHHGSLTRNTDEDTHARAIQDYFTANKTTIPRGMMHSVYSPANGNGSCAIGYFLNGYDSNPFGGYFVAHYKKAWYVGVDNGKYQQFRIATTTLDNISSSKTPLYIDDGILKSCLVETHINSYAFYGTSSFNIKLTRFQIHQDLYIINIRASVPTACYKQKGKELYTTAVTSGGTIYTLPSGYRPSETITSCLYAADSSNENEAAVNIAIFSDGKIRFHGGTTLPTHTSEASNAGLNMWYLGTGS